MILIPYLSWGSSPQFEVDIMKSVDNARIPAIMLNRTYVLIIGEADYESISSWNRPKMSLWSNDECRDV